MRAPPPRQLAFVALAVGLAAVFVRLGVWQLDRLGERMDENRRRAARLAEGPLDLGSVAPFPALDSVAWRRVRIAGEYDYAREIVVRGRSLRGVPGVYLLTPLRRAVPGGGRSADGAAAVLVLRGWMPAPDGLRADLPAARPTVSRGTIVEGIALEGDRRTGAAPPAEVELSGERHAVLSTLDLDDARRSLPYPAAAFYVHAAGDGRGSPVAVPPPALDRGPHLVYAIQWFAFALIAVVGTVAWLRRAGRADGGRTSAAERDLDR